MNAHRVFAFSAKIVQPVLTVPFFVIFAHWILLEGSSLDNTRVSAILDCSVYLGRHGPIVIFTRKSDSNELVAHKYIWSHPTMRPHGEDPGIQCKTCGAITSRHGIVKEGGKIFNSCTRCDTTVIYEHPRNARALKPSGEGGRWMIKPVQWTAETSKATDTDASPDAVTPTGTTTTSTTGTLSASRCHEQSAKHQGLSM